MIDDDSLGILYFSMYYPDDVLIRWVEREIDLNPPKNLHLTQVLWRPTKYMGCADAMREYDDGTRCHVQVCRYVRTGNCNFGKFEETNWMVPMLLDSPSRHHQHRPSGRTGHDVSKKLLIHRGIVSDIFGSAQIADCGCRFHQ